VSTNYRAGFIAFENHGIRTLRVAAFEESNHVRVITLLL
jgi:hypothetical protein